MGAGERQETQGGMCMKRASVTTGMRREYYQGTELHYPVQPWHTSRAQKPHHAACQRAASPAALIALGIAASLTLLCKEQDHWRQVPKSSKGAGKEDTDLRASAIKGDFETVGAMARRGERPDAESLLVLSPNCSDQLLFSILFVCANTTWQKFFPIELFREKPQDWEQKQDRRTPSGGLTFYFSIAKRGKSPFIPLQFLLFYGLFYYFIPLHCKERKNLMGDQLFAEEGLQHAQGRAVNIGHRARTEDLQAPRFISLAQSCAQGGWHFAL